MTFQGYRSRAAEAKQWLISRYAFCHYISNRPLGTHFGKEIENYLN